jgi:hypothetical protein
MSFFCHSYGQQGTHADSWEICSSIQNDNDERKILLYIRSELYVTPIKISLSVCLCAENMDRTAERMFMKYDAT